MLCLLCSSSSQSFMLSFFLSFSRYVNNKRSKLTCCHVEQSSRKGEIERERRRWQHNFPTARLSFQIVVFFFHFFNLLNTCLATPTTNVGSRRSRSRRNVEVPWINRDFDLSLLYQSLLSTDLLMHWPKNKKPMGQPPLYFFSFWLAFQYPCFFPLVFVYDHT